MQALSAHCSRDLALKLGAIPVLELPAWCVAHNRRDATRMDFVDLRVEDNRSCAWPIDLNHAYPVDTHRY